jgi:carbamoyltransferase
LEDFMLILGLGGFMHDYNCCLVDTDGQHVAMAEAERLSRRKHHTIEADEDLLVPIRKCCRDLRVKPRDIDVVVVGHTDPFACKDRFRRALPKAAWIEIDHHLCHAAGAFFSSPYDEALIVSVDGFGDGSSALIATGRGTTIEEPLHIDEANSIGLEYLRATFHLGLGGYGAEGKTQGLSAYGEPTLFAAYMNEIDVSDDGRVRLGDQMRGPSSALTAEGGYLNTQLLTNDFLSALSPRRIAPEPLTKVHNDLAASVQKMLEHVVIEICLAGQRRTGQRNLVLSGGVAMNSSLNGRLLSSGAFDHIFVLPMASDRGIGLGAALSHAHQKLGVDRFFALDDVFFGDAFDNRAAVRAMRKGGLKHRRSDDIYMAAAEALAQGKIVGWFQGRSEMGARALGNRSILADPRVAGMKDVLNSRVKHREWFRPFAPAVLAEHAADYFEFPSDVADLSFMTFTVNSTERGKSDIPASIHVDGTARVQTVDAGRHADFHRLISRFADLTGVPVLLNTSFNDQGEPIVETPEDAVATFLKTDMDLLCVGDVVGTKP